MSDCFSCGCDEILDKKQLYRKKSTKNPNIYFGFQFEGIWSIMAGKLWPPVYEVFGHIESLQEAESKQEVRLPSVIHFC